MGHLGAGKTDVFRALAERLDRNPVGAPLNETLMRIVHIMYNEQEAAVGSKFPQGFTTLARCRPHRHGRHELRPSWRAWPPKGWSTTCRAATRRSIPSRR
jgi:hypothetical protein